MVTLIFYFLSILIFMTLGFFRSSYWIIAVILTTIYCLFVLSVYISTKKKSHSDLESSEIFALDGQDFELRDIHGNVTQSIIEEHEVSIFQNYQKITAQKLLGEDHYQDKVIFDDNLRAEGSQKRPQKSDIYKVWLKTLQNIEKSWSEMNIFEKIEYCIESPIFFLL